MRHFGRILVLEDEPSLSMAICDELEFEDFEVFVVEEGVEELDRILKDAPDLKGKIDAGSSFGIWKPVDGQRIAFSTSVNSHRDADVWVMQNFLPESGPKK